MRTKTTLRTKIVLLLAVAASALALSGCGGEKKAALEGLTKLEEVCKAKDMDAAKKHVEELRGKNGAFKKAWDDAVTGIEPDRVNYCSVMTHMKVKTTLEW
jgi:hypothetical protein